MIATVGLFFAFSQIPAKMFCQPSSKVEQPEFQMEHHKAILFSTAGLIDAFYRTQTNFDLAVQTNAVASIAVSPHQSN